LLPSFKKAQLLHQYLVSEQKLPHVRDQGSRIQPVIGRCRNGAVVYHRLTAVVLDIE
jgi:hypothetical protein